MIDISLGLPTVLLIDFEAAIKEGETRVGGEKYVGDIYFASSELSMDPARKSWIPFR
jgi:hypothetical protein